MSLPGVRVLLNEFEHSEHVKHTSLFVNLEDTSDAGQVTRIQLLAGTVLTQLGRVVMASGRVVDSAGAPVSMAPNRR